MSEQAFNRIRGDFENWHYERVYDDHMCLYEISKTVDGRFDIERRDVQTCPDGCETLKTYLVGGGEVSTYEQCDSEVSASILDGTWDEMEAVRAAIDGDWTRRGGVAGKLVWNGAGGTVQCLFNAISRAGTHHWPVAAAGECEECDNDNHWEGWIRGAVVEGEYEGSTLFAAFAFNMDQQNGVVAFSGTVEGVLIRQC